MQKTIYALLAITLFCAGSCTQNTDNTPANYLECPADPAPVKGYGGRGSIVMPNAFSPNGDGRNDVFQIVQKDTLAIRSVVLRIVAADGTLITTLNHSIDSWDGINRSTGKSYPAGKYRVDYGIVMHGGSGADAVLNGHTCIKLYATDSSGCLIRQGNPAEDVFGDQVDPATSDVIYSTAEQICN